jgi:hypothetical protein
MDYYKSLIFHHVVGNSCANTVTRHGKYGHKGHLRPHRWDIMPWMSFCYVGLIKHHPHIASACEMSVVAPCVGAHFQPTVLIAYQLDLQGVLC